MKIDEVAFVRLALATLSKRLVDGAFAFTALSLGFVLWSRLPLDPTAGQLGGVGLYGLFALAILLVRRS